MRAFVVVLVLAGACSNAPLLDPSGGGGRGGAGAGAAGAGVAGAGVAGTNATGAAGAGGDDRYPPTGINAQLPGPGCGKALPSGQIPTVAGTPRGYFQYTVQGTGRTLGADQPAKVGPRTFWVRVPPDYDNTRPYRVVYIGQGCGAYESANNNTFQLFKEPVGGTEQAIYVAMDIPTDMANLNCYDNRDGALSQEWEAFELFHTVVDSNYCVDNNRLYVAGYSTGGWLANMWGCYFAGDGMNPASTPGAPRKFAPKYHIRAQAAMTGGEPANNPPCNGKVAAFWLHDAGDVANVISGNVAALTRVGAMNGCDTTYDKPEVQAPWHPEVTAIGDVCRRFTTCPGDYPVVFCTTRGLGRSDQHDRVIPALKLFFDELDPPFMTSPPVVDAGTAGSGGAAGVGGGEAGTGGGAAGTGVAAQDAGVEVGPPLACTSVTFSSPKVSAQAFCTNLLATCSALDGLPPPALYATEASCEGTYSARTSNQQQCQSYHLCGNAFGKSMTDRKTHCPHAWGMGPCMNP